MTVAEGFAGFENEVLPRENHGPQLHLVAPWHEDLAESPDAAEAPEAAPVTVPSFDRQAAAATLHEVLREWRAICRELELIRPGGLDGALLLAQADALRAVHQRLFVKLNRA